MQPWRGYERSLVHGNLWLLQYVISGEGTFLGESFKAPVMFVLEPNHMLSYSINKDSEPCEQYWMKLTGENVRGFLEDAGIPTKTGVYPIQYANQLRQNFIELTTDQSYTGRDDHYFMLHGFLTNCELHRNSIRAKDSAPIFNSYTSAAIEYIHANYTEPLSESDLASHLHISKSYMHKIFRHDMKITPNHYLNKYRISCAKKLLSSTNLSVAQIAESVGFSSGDYFCRVFQKFMKQSPTDYRKTNR